MAGLWPAITYFRVLPLGADKERSVSRIKSKFRRFGRFEVAEFDCPDHVFSKHSHDEFVIGANITGRETVTLDRRSFEAGDNQLTLYNPAQVQSSHANSTVWSFVSIYMRPRDFAALTGIDENAVFEDPTPTSVSLSKSLITFVREALDASADEDMLNLRLGDLLLDLLDVSGAAQLGAERPSDMQMQMVAEQLMDHIAEPPRLADMAQHLGLSPVALVRAFKKAYGLPPFEWLNVQRINTARQQLRRGHPLTEIAYDLGYADQPHFNRRFKAATGLTPSRFQQVK